LRIQRKVTGDWGETPYERKVGCVQGAKECGQAVKLQFPSLLPKAVLPKYSTDIHTKHATICTKISYIPQLEELP